MSKIVLSYEQEQQTQSLLCWAAVSRSIAKYFGKTDMIAQEDLAQEVFGERYNRVHRPAEALAFVGHLKEEIARPLTLKEIENELLHNRPIAACMRFFIGWHLAVIYGIDNATLYIADPLFGHSKMSLEDFTERYRSHHWTHSYLTRP